MTDHLADGIRRTLIDNAETNQWARDIPRLFGKDRIEDLTDDEVLDAGRVLDQARRRKEARDNPVGADFRARMQSMGCGCPVLYDRDSRGREIQSSASVDHLTTCGLKAGTNKVFRVESE